jgi:hypothetical protein
VTEFLTAYICSANILELVMSDTMTPLGAIDAEAHDPVPSAFNKEDVQQAYHQNLIVRLEYFSICNEAWIQKAVSSITRNKAGDCQFVVVC